MAKNPRSNEDGVGPQLAKATKLASKVALEAREQWAGYKKDILSASEAVEAAAKKIDKPSDAEKELMAASAKTAASVADVFLEFAETALEVMQKQGKDTRQRASRLVREVVKLAVDDTLGDERSAPRTARTLELRPNRAWETFYLPPAERGEEQAKVFFECTDTSVHIQLRTSPTPWDDDGIETFSAEELDQADGWRSMTFYGPRPSLSVRLAAEYELQKNATGLLTLQFGEKLSVFSLMLLRD